MEHSLFNNLTILPDTLYIPKANPYSLDLYSSNSIEDTMEDSKTIINDFNENTCTGYRLHHNTALMEQDNVKDKDMLEVNELPIERLKSKNSCNCSMRYSMCIEANCECFRVGKTCKGCTHNHCYNISPYQFIVQNNVEEKGYQMILNEDLGPTRKRSKVEIKCNCGRGGCKKKMCKCIQFGVGCSLDCTCENCTNVKVKKPKIEKIKRKYK